MTIDKSDIEYSEWDVFSKKVFEAAHDLVAYSTVPIAGTLEGKSTFDRTGVLIKIGGLPFLVTANHNIGEIIDADYRLFIPPPVPSGKMIAFGYEHLWRATRDVADVAMFRLSSDTFDALEQEDYRFLGLRDIACYESVPAGPFFYLVAGFPTALESKDDQQRKRIEYCPWLTSNWPGNVDELSEPVDLEANILLDYDRNARRSNGEYDKTPNPNGLSGCGVWCLCRADLISLWKPDDMKLVGIQGSWFHRARCLKATWIDEVLAMIWNKYPETRRPLQLIGFHN